MGLDFRPAAIYNGGIYMSFWNVLLVIIVILAILLVVLYILGSPDAETSGRAADYDRRFETDSFDSGD